MRFPKLKTKLILAPMAGFSDTAFRILCRKYGAGLAYTDMLHADFLTRHDMKFYKKDKPLTLQIFGNDADIIYKAGLKYQDKVDIIDLNLGCPSHKIISSGSGSYLMNKLNKVDEILSKLSKLEIPVSVKLRIHKNLKKIVKICEDNSVSAICLHGRTVEQGFSGKVDLDAIKKLKEMTKMIVIGNGNVFKYSDAEKMFDYTKCDYVMIGRGSLGNPAIFKNKDVDKIKMFFEYYRLWKKYKCDYNNLLWHTLAFTKSLAFSKRLRVELAKCRNDVEIFKVIRNFKLCRHK
ncbi:MAG: tRNA-dihydrouridine synthase family protein [Nanoarchaeota archaeon]|nr:tRNA-dihydrouridine synthase family protein [Nanoarchaeota archaeon]